MHGLNSTFKKCELEHDSYIFIYRRKRIGDKLNSYLINEKDEKYGSADHKTNILYIYIYIYIYILYIK